MTVTAVLELTINPDALEIAPGIITETLATTRAFAGCLGCTVAVDVDDPQHFVIVEQWESIEADNAYRAFRATPEGASRLGEITSGRRLTRYENTTA